MSNNESRYTMEGTPQGMDLIARYIADETRGYYATRKAYQTCARVVTYRELLHAMARRIYEDSGREYLDRAA